MKSLFVIISSETGFYLNDSAKTSDKSSSLIIIPFFIIINGISFGFMSFALLTALHRDFELPGIIVVCSMCPATPACTRGYRGEGKCV